MSKIHEIKYYKFTELSIKNLPNEIVRLIYLNLFMQWIWIKNKEPGVIINSTKKFFKHILRCKKRENVLPVLKLSNCQISRNLENKYRKLVVQYKLSIVH